MTTRFEKAAARNTSSIKAAAGVRVTYARPSANASVVVTAVPAQTRGEQDAGDGVVLAMAIEDFLIEADDLVLDNGVGRTEPLEFDTLTVERAGLSATYEVMPPGGSEPAWRFSDPARTRYRIHTKLIAEA